MTDIVELFVVPENNCTYDGGNNHSFKNNDILSCCDSRRVNCLFYAKLTVNNSHVFIKKDLCLKNYKLVKL